MGDTISLTLDDLRSVTAHAVDAAAEVLAIFERLYPADARPRAALAAATAFVAGGPRNKALRDVSWAALKAAQEADSSAAEHAARAAMAASAAAYLHPLPNATQVKHILGAAAHAARAAEIAADNDPSIGNARVDAAAQRATPALIAVLRRFPPAPSGGGRVGELLRRLDTALREATD